MARSGASPQLSDVPDAGLSADIARLRTAIETSRRLRQETADGLARVRLRSRVHTTLANRWAFAPTHEAQRIVDDSHKARTANAFSRGDPRGGAPPTVHRTGCPFQRLEVDCTDSSVGGASSSPQCVVGSPLDNVMKVGRRIG